MCQQKDKRKKMKMNTVKFGILATAIVLSSMAVSCKKKGCTDPNATNYNEKAKKDDGTCEYPASTEETVVINGVTYTKISGTLNANTTWVASKKYLLSGGVFVDGNATLTIQAGTMIYAADDNTTPFLAIQRGAKIMAEGTANSPIVFTSIKSNPVAGDWGGIIINGKAPINNGVDPIGEGNTGAYGGNVANDNSGTLRYVRVEFAGKQITADNELNGFSFNGVGSATVLDHLQAYKCADDGFEFFGGTVNLSNALSYGSGDDSFDWTFGWSGTGTNWVVMQDGTGDRGLEGDNNSSNNSATPASNPTLINIYLKGNGAADNKVGAKLREGMKANITNIEIVDFKTGIEIEHDVTLQNVIGGSLTVTNATCTNVTTNTSFKGSKDAQGNEINPQLKVDAQASGNVVVDGTGSVSLAWITGTWFREL